MARYRWFQFRLRSILLLMLVACLFMGWVDRQRREYVAQQHVIDEIEAIGGSVLTREKGPAWLRFLVSSTAPN